MSCSRLRTIRFDKIGIFGAIIEKIKKIINNIGNASFINTSALLSNNEKIGNGDDMHFFP